MGTGRLDEAASTAARMLLSAPGRAERAQVEGAVAFMLLRMGRVVEALDRYRVAADLAKDRTGKGLFLARAAQAGCLAGELETARVLAEQARISGERGHDAVAVAEALAARAAVVHFAGDPVGAVRIAHRAAATAGSEGPAAIAAAVASLLLSAALADADRLPEAEGVMTGAVQGCRRAGATVALPLVQSFRAVNRLLAGHWNGSAADCRDVLAMAESMGSRIASPLGWGVLALIEAGRGNTQSARQLLEASGTHRLSPVGPYGEEWILLGRAVAADDPRAAYEHLLTAWYCSRRRPWFLVWRVVAPTLVRAALRLGDDEVARDVAAAAREGDELAGGVASARACADQCQGMVDRDVELLARSRDGYQAGGRPYWQAKADVDLALAWIERQRPDRAVPLLREATDLFHGLGATRAQARTGMLLAHCGGDVPARAAPDPLRVLTRAERAVAVRAGEGKTNPEIADDLVLSARTVQAHLSSVYAKLGIGSRVQLAALLGAHGGSDERQPSEA